MKGYVVMKIKNLWTKFLYAVGIKKRPKEMIVVKVKKAKKTLVLK